MEAAAFLRGLTLVEVPLPLEVLALFTPHPGEPALALLEQRGLTTRQCRRRPPSVVGQSLGGEA